MSPRSHSPNSPNTIQPGFALIATISVMVLLVMVALAMLSLATLEQRSANRSDAMATAQANARMALMIAIGELQKNTGPDQRITAEADILDSTGFAGWTRDDSRKHYVGVYSTEDWHTKDSSGKPPAWKPYDKDRNKDAFLRWLVSGTPAQVESLELAKTKASGIQVLGEGTLGTDADDSENITIPLVSVTDGKYAWWVGDEGIKAKVNLHDDRQLSTHQNTYKRRYEAMNPSSVGINAITDFEVIDRKSHTPQEYAKLQTSRQLALLNPTNLDKDIVGKHFHDYTTFSSGVLADVTTGGLKRDLSIPFELPSLRPPQGASPSAGWPYTLSKSDLPAARHGDYHSIWEFSNSGESNSTYTLANWGAFRPDWWGEKMGYVFSFPSPEKSP